MTSFFQELQRNFFIVYLCYNASFESSLSLSLCFLVSIDFVFGHGFKEEKLTVHFSSPQLLNLFFFLQMECTHSLLAIFSSLWNKSAGSFCSGFNCTLVFKCLPFARLLAAWLTTNLSIADQLIFFLLCCFVTDDSEICDLWRIYTVHCLEREEEENLITIKLPLNGPFRREKQGKGMRREHSFYLFGV